MLEVDFDLSQCLAEDYADVLSIEFVSELASEPMSQGDRERHHRACEGMS
jgi:hypothetical protein